jgi:hypothetical protein
MQEFIEAFKQEHQTELKEYKHIQNLLSDIRKDGWYKKTSEILSIAYHDNSEKPNLEAMLCTQSNNLLRKMQLEFEKEYAEYIFAKVFQE